MASIVNNKSISFLDVREKPELKILDLSPNQDNYEAELYTSICSEFNDIAGFDVDIYIMNPKAIDHMYGESTCKGFEGPFRSKFLYAPEVEKSLIDTFGFSNDYTIQYGEMTKAIWIRDVVENLDRKEDIEYDIEEYEKPKPGDLIKTLWDDSLYEITNVSSGEKIFKGNKLIWSFTLKPYVYDSESSEAKEILFEELELNDFPDSNISRLKLTDEQLNMEKEIVEKEASKNTNFDEIDPSVYGYFVNRKD